MDSRHNLADELAAFKCARNHDVERFLHKDAIPYEQSHRARSYLIVNQQEDPDEHLEILAYFSLSIHVMTIGESVSNSMKKHLVGMYCNKKEVQRVPCFLIGQLAKSDSFGKEMNGKELISSAVTAINRVHQTVGGRFIKIDCHEEMEKVIRLYVENGFTPIQTNKNHLVEMVMFFDKLPRGKTAT